MFEDIAKSVKSLLEQKKTVADREKQLIEDLNRVLPTMGYRVVRVESEARDRGKSASKSNEKSTAVKGGKGRVYACDQCGRKFGHWLHLGRHVSTIHRRGKKAA
jgi:hypothetical protein